ncbi:MAG TPA: class I SAM-dependent methyltransferase [Planctomycetota bacterium]|nr:class I SAM-dependent methyltransferase [Planctomycetota bacterium]
MRGVGGDYWEGRAGYRAPDAPSARAFADPKAERIVRWAGLKAGEVILDVGAGTGHLTEAFRRRGFRVVAVDAAAGMLARNTAGARVRADAARLPFRAGAFALAAESNLLHHVEDPVAALAEMARVSAGRVAAIEPNRNHPPMLLFSLLVREEWRGLRFTRSHLARLAAAAGLSVERLEVTGWVYQNRTPSFLAGFLGRRDGACPLAAYVVGLFRGGRGAGREGRA